MKKLFTTAIVILVLLSFSRSSLALIINGDFETGGLTGWNVKGPGSITVEADGTNHYARTATGYDPVTGEYITTLSQDFIIPSNPQSITFDFYFDTTAPSGPWIDALTASLETNRGNLYDFLVIDNTGMTLNPLATAKPSSIFSGGYTLSLDAATYANANATLYFDLWDEDDQADSTAKIDNVAVNPVPAPDSVMLLLSGLLGVLGIKRRGLSFFSNC